MSHNDWQSQYASAEETIRALQGELAETNRGLLALTLELEQRVDSRTAELRAAHDELQRTNAELMQLTMELEDRVAQLTESEERFRTLAETANDAILSADSRGHIVYFNGAAERIFSFSAEEIRGQPLTLLMPERFREPHRRGFDRFLRTGEAQVIGKTVEMAGRRKDGTEFPIELSLSSWKTRAGIFFTAILSDITERRQAEQALEQHRNQLVWSNAELAATNQELEAFSYSVSHDLRAPLRSIDGFSQALLEDYGDRLDPAAQGHLQRVRAATQRMSILIDDLLNLSRVTRVPMRREAVNLTALARSVAQELQQDSPDRQAGFHIEEGLLVEGDPHLLRVMLQNLLGNSWKYTSKHERARIEFGRQLCDGRCVYFVRDDGAGFDPRYAGRLFGAFQRLHSESEFPGTGVGLATVQRILRRHGGEVWAEGAVENGATFYFTLGPPGG